MSFQSQPLVSVITPVYNEEKYLAECIESVLAQTYANWELTIINNRSTDRSLEIAENYAQRDRRICVMTTPEFYPQLHNHNFAMRQISPESKYCKVVLGDNWIFPDCLRLMVEAAEAHPTVGIVSALRLTSSGIQANSLPYPSLCIPGHAFCRLQLLADEDYFGSATMVLFRSEIVRKRDPFFREKARSADAEACYEILQEWDFAFLHQLLTFNRTDNVSISTPSRRFAPYFLNQFIHIKRYGHIFLTPAENTTAHRQFERAYYAFLAERAMERPGKIFWDYHRAALATINERLSSLQLTKQLLLEILDVFLNPKKTFVRLLRSHSVHRAALAASVKPAPKHPLSGELNHS
jgi:glycosyltransferase involved in cell wall biosynthesis